MISQCENGNLQQRWRQQEGVESSLSITEKNQAEGLFVSQRLGNRGSQEAVALENEPQILDSFHTEIGSWKRRCEDVALARVAIIRQPRWETRIGPGFATFQG